MATGICRWSWRRVQGGSFHLRGEINRFWALGLSRVVVWFTYYIGRMRQQPKEWVKCAQNDLIDILKQSVGCLYYPSWTSICIGMRGARRKSPPQPVPGPIPRNPRPRFNLLSGPWFSGPRSITRSRAPLFRRALPGSLLSSILTRLTSPLGLRQQPIVVADAQQLPQSDLDSSRGIERLLLVCFYDWRLIVLIERQW